MLKKIILKQGNWYEERSDKSNRDNYFYKEQKFTQKKYDVVSLTKV